MYHLYGK
jgi:hypothetical protein